VPDEIRIDPSAPVLSQANQSRQAQARFLGGSYHGPSAEPRMYYSGDGGGEAAGGALGAGATGGAAAAAGVAAGSNGPHVPAVVTHTRPASSQQPPPPDNNKGLGLLLGAMGC
jgi:hypothetical protein